MKPAIRFFDPALEPDHTYTYAIIVSRHAGRLVWVRHRDRTTWELPAGHLEPGETPFRAAQRELYEETGALEYRLDQKIAYEGVYDGNQVFGMIFLAEIAKLGPLPDFEIAEIGSFDGMPADLTYPDIQPVFLRYVLDSPPRPEGRG